MAKTSEAPIHIFVVEDDPVYNRMLCYLMEQSPEHVVHSYTSARQALDHLHLRPQILLLDYSLPDLTGEELLRRVLAYDNRMACVMVSGQRDVQTAVGLLRAGARDYLVKEGDAKDRIQNVVQHIKRGLRLEEEVSSLRQAVADTHQFRKLLLGDSPAMRALYRLMEKAANTNITVALYGETGTGKEMVAQAIHYNSARKHKPFVAVNVTAIPDTLIESELFGHEKGAFTGAHTRRRGKFEQAQGGSLFLDEIGEMDLAMQAKLLRVLQEQEVTPVGGEKPVKLDVRLLIATHRDLERGVQEGWFRQDLYFRLLGLSLQLPPLRDRGHDCLMLAQHFLKTYARQNQLPAQRFSEAARQKLLAHPFPGNVRELKAVVELAAVMAEGPEVQADDLTLQGAASLEGMLKSEQSLEEYNRLIVKHFLEKYDHNVVTVAQKLKIGKSTLYRMLKQYPELAGPAPAAEG